jgi:hypothetical protein
VPRAPAHQVGARGVGPRTGVCARVCCRGCGGRGRAFAASGWSGRVRGVVWWDGRVLRRGAGGALAPELRGKAGEAHLAVEVGVGPRVAASVQRHQRLPPPRSPSKRAAQSEPPQAGEHMEARGWRAAHARRRTRRSPTPRPHMETHGETPPAPPRPGQTDPRPRPRRGGAAHLGAAQQHELPQGPVLRLRVARPPRRQPLLQRLLRRLPVPQVPQQ